MGRSRRTGSLNEALQWTRRRSSIGNILPKICKAAEYENAIFSLAKELERTQKLINALEYVIIPQYEHAISFIRSALEEREKEEFVRLKKVKVVLDRKKSIFTTNKGSDLVVYYFLGLFQLLFDVLMKSLDQFSYN